MATREAVGLIPTADHDAWDAFAREAGTIFHSAWWHRAWGAGVAVYARTDDDGSITAGLALHVKRYLGTRAVRRPPLTPLNGPLIGEPPASNRSGRHSWAKKQTNAIMEAVPRLGLYDFVVRPGTTDALPFLWNGYRSGLTHTYVLPNGERDQWRDNMSEMNRRNLNKARREADEADLSVDNDADVSEIAELLKDTARAKGFSFQRAAARLGPWWDEVRRREAGRLYIIRDGDGAPCAATVMVWDARTAYYLAGGMRDGTRRSSRLNLLLFERMITDAHEMGLDFDFEGSSLPGVERFFRGWGGQLLQGTRFVKIPSFHTYVLWTAADYVKRGRHRREWVSLP